MKTAREMIRFIGASLVSIVVCLCNHVKVSKQALLFEELGGNDDIRWQTCYRGSKQTQNNIRKIRQKCYPFQLRGETLHLFKWRNGLHFSYDAVRRSM